MEPVFMIGTQRSGSNLLRLMLNQLNEIASPHPPHIFERMQPLIDTYGDLEDKRNFSQLIDDVCRLVELNPVEWQNVKFDRKDIASRCKQHTLSAVYAAIHDVYAKANNAKTWCCKSLVNINYTDIIEQSFAKPKYIYLYRDGRDVALSFQKAIVGEKHIYNIAKDWAETQEKAIDLINSIGSDRVFCISYEQLTTEPQVIAKKLCKFLKVKYNSSMLDFYKTTEASNAASSSKLWGNVINPVMNNNSGKYKKEMSADDIKIFESVAGPMLDRLGYSREHVKSGAETAFSNEDIASFMKANVKMKSETVQHMDKEDVKRRERQANLIIEIKSRVAPRACVA